MISKSLREMVKGRWREFKREPSAMFFVVLMPILWMVILGLAFSSPKVARFQVAVLSEAQPALLARVKQAFADNPQLKMREGSRAEVQRWLQRNEIQVAIEGGPEGSLVYHFDPTNPEGLNAKQISDDLLQRSFGRHDVITTAEAPINAVGHRYIDFLIPGLLALSMLTTSFYGTGMTLVAHRRENLLKRYRATPMNPYEYILSHIIGRYMILAVEMMTVMATGMLLFGFRLAGSWPAYFAVCLLSTAAFMALAILCGCRLNNTATYNGLNNLVVLPMMMLAGVWFSRSGFPSWLVAITDYLPLTASVEALRKVALEGAGLMDLSFELALLAVYAIIATIAAKRAFRWY